MYTLPNASPGQSAVCVRIYTHVHETQLGRSVSFVSGVFTHTY